MRLFAFVGSVLALMLPEAAHAADWLQVTSPNFVLYTDVGEAGARKRAERLELFDAVLRQRHGVSLKEPARRRLPVYLLRNETDLRRISPGIGDNIAGFYVSTPDDTFAVATDALQNDAVLLHEYVHHFMLGQSGFTYPGWLIEGYAEYYMTARISPDTVVIGDYHRERAPWLGGIDWVPFDRLLKIRPGQLRDSMAVNMYYAESWALTHYMLSDPERRRQLDAYVRAVGAGGDPVTSLTAATGLKPSALQDAVKTYILGRFPTQRYERGAFVAPAVTVTRLPDGSGPLMLLAQRIKRDNGVDAPDDKTDGPVLLADARRLARARTGDRLADLTLARAEIKLGDLAEADRLLAGVLAAAPEDVDALQLSAASRLKAAETAPEPRTTSLRAEARTLAGRAYKLDPNRYQTLMLYAQGRENAADYPRENDLAVLQDALNLAPQVTLLRLKAAEALMARKRWSEAVAVLRPLANDPHAGQETAAVRQLLGELEAQAASAAPAS